MNENKLREMDQVDEAAALCSVLEGTCPGCDGDVEIESVGGYPGWLEDGCPYSLDGVKVDTWTRPTEEFDGLARVLDNLRDNPGAVQFRCAGCGAEFYTEATIHGDWVMGG